MRPSGYLPEVHLDNGEAHIAPAVIAVRNDTRWEWTGADVAKPSQRVVEAVTFGLCGTTPATRSAAKSRTMVTAPFPAHTIFGTTRAANTGNAEGPALAHRA